MIDVTAYWSGEDADARKRRFRLRISREADYVIALLSETPEDLQTVNSSKDISTILEKELHMAATSAASTFGLDLLDTVWLREIKHPDRLAVYRIVMDEEKGRFVNARYGELTSLDAVVLKQKGMSGKGMRRPTVTEVRRRHWISRLQPVAWATAVFAIAIGSGLLMSKINRESQALKLQLSSIQAERDDASRKLMALELIEKERQLASSSTLRKVFQDGPQPEITIVAAPAPEQQPDRPSTIQSWFAQLSDRFSQPKSTQPQTKPD